MKRSLSAISPGGGRGIVVIFAAMCMSIVWAHSLHAQSRAVHLSARYGVGSPSDDYQSNCGHSSMAFSLDVAGRRQIFPQVSFDHFSGSGGGDVLCVVDPAISTAVGGLRLEGSSRLGLGVGGRVGVGPVALEGVVSGGIVRGQHGYVADPADDSRHVMPHVGGQATLVVFRFVLLSGAINWTRLTMNLTPTSGGPVDTQTTWSPLGTLQLGLRLPADR